MTAKVKTKRQLINIAVKRGYKNPVCWANAILKIRREK